VPVRNSLFAQFPAKQHSSAFHLAREVEQANVDVFHLNSGGIDLGESVFHPLNGFLTLRLAPRHMNDVHPQTPAEKNAMGKFLQDSNINDLYIISPNYQAGKDMVAGLKRYYKGRIVEEIYTKFQQQDYQAEISQLRSKNPKAVFAFYPGGMGIQFVKQYVQAGLRDQIPLYTVFTVDETTLPALREAAIGQYEARFWSPDIKIPASQKYVADFRKKFGYTPSFYGAQSYDSIMLIDSAVRATKGNLKDTQALVKAMRKADFDSIRGRFTYNVNHHPIQDFYLLQAVKSSGPDGAEMRILQKAFEKHKDAYSQDCKMKW